MSYKPRLKERYKGEIIQALRDQFGYKSVMQVPRLQKIVLSQGIGDAVADKKIIENAATDLSRIAGQKAITTLSKKRYFKFQIKKRNADWDKSNFKRRSNV